MLTNPSDPLFREVFACRTEDGQRMAADLLARNGLVPTVGEDYVYAPGDIPILLVAHTDTVHRAPPEKLYHDANHRAVWAPNGLGADDRAGVYGIATLLREGFRPHVLFTDKEETGGIGAESAGMSLAAPDVRLMVQMDRAGATDAVYYSYDPPRSLRKYLRRRGFETAQGTYTDIAALMPCWDIGGVNLSIGYYGQHTRGEYLLLAEMDRTIGAVASILSTPPTVSHGYRPRREHLRERFDWGQLAALTSSDNLGGEDWTEDDDSNWRRWEDDDYRRLLEADGK